MASGRGAAWGWGRLQVSSRESLAPALIVADFKELFPQAGHPMVVGGVSFPVRGLNYCASLEATLIFLVLKGRRLCPEYPLPQL